MVSSKDAFVVVGCCGCSAVAAFFGFWTIFSIVGAIHYSVWYPRFDLKDVHIRGFDVTPNGSLSYDMDILIETHHFSSIRRIEEYSYEVRSSHAGVEIGSSSVDGFHPKPTGGRDVMEIVSRQNATRMGIPGWLSPLVRQDLNATGRVALRVYIRAQVYTPLFLAMKKRREWICDLIVSPRLPFGSQIYDRRCCDDFRCLKTCKGADDSDYCCYRAPNCCLLPPSSARSTISICG